MYRPIFYSFNPNRPSGLTYNFNDSPIPGRDANRVFNIYSHNSFPYPINFRYLVAPTNHYETNSDYIKEL